MPRLLAILFALGLPAAASAAGGSSLPAPDRLAIGVNDLGGQLRVRIAGPWAAEARFSMGSASSVEGSIHSTVVGARVYRFFEERHRSKLYLSLEGGYAETSIRSPSGNSGSIQGTAGLPGLGNTSGYVLGGVGGVEFRPFRRIAIDLDMGPYLITLKEKLTGVSDSRWDLVVNAAAMIYLF